MTTNKHTSLKHCAGSNGLMISHLPTGGATGTILLGDEADRYPDYWILDMNVNGVFDIAAATDSTINGSSVQRVGTTMM